MNKSIYFFAVVSCFVLSVALAHAGGEKCILSLFKESNVSPQGAVFKSMDTNGDGLISKAEFDAYYAKQSTKCLRDMDADKDGWVMPDEMQDGSRGGQKQNSAAIFLEQRFNAADTNRDGVLDREEANTMPMLKAYFDKVDANKDGKVTLEEYLGAMPLLHRAIGIDSSGKGVIL